MLTVAIERDQAVVSVLERIREHAFQGRSVTAIGLVAQDLDRFEGPQEFRRAVGRAVIDDEQIASVLQDLGHDRLDVAFFVVNGNRGEQSHAREHHRVKRIVSSVPFDRRFGRVYPTFAE